MVASIRMITFALWECSIEENFLLKMCQFLFSFSGTGNWWMVVNGVIRRPSKPIPQFLYICGFCWVSNIYSDSVSSVSRYISPDSNVARVSVNLNVLVVGFLFMYNRFLVFKSEVSPINFASLTWLENVAKLMKKPHYCKFVISQKSNRWSYP